MNQLIPLQSQTIDGNAVETVSARELHEFLESKQDFSNWIKNRIEKYEFVENQDYVSLHKKMEREIGGTTRIEKYEFVENQDFVSLHKKMEANNATMIEYFVSVGMAKELAVFDPTPIF